MKKIELICIGCPLGCPLTVTYTDSDEAGMSPVADGTTHTEAVKTITVTEVTGNTCPRGDAYARKEVTNPTRIVTSTLRVKGGAAPMVSCKTASDIPKNKIFAVTEALKNICVYAPILIGDVLVENVADTGVDIIATKDIKRL